MTQQSQAELTEIEKKIYHDQEVMKRWKVAAIPCSSSKENDDELSEGEFMQKGNFQRDEHVRKVSGQRLVEESKKRKKKADREQKRLGGPIILWTFAGIKRGETTMAKREELAAKIAAEKEAKKAAKKAAKEKTKESSKTAKKEKTKKDKTGKKAKKERKDRRPRVIDGKIALLEKTNPKREGSKAHKRYELYKKHKTIAGYLEAGGKRSTLRYDEKHGFIKTSGVTTSADVKTKEKKEK